MLALSLATGVALTAASPVSTAPAEADAQIEALRGGSAPELIARGRAALAALGDYQVRLTQEERIHGKLQPAQTLQMWVREKPFAVRIEYVAGRSKGRRALYDSQARPKDIRVREAGFLSIAGSLWISIDSSLLFKETNHPITDIGLGSVLRFWAADAEKARAFGGAARTDPGLNARGRYCIQYDAPAGATGLYAVRSILCLDPATALPLEVTDWDKDGLLERFVFEGLEPHAAEGPEVFTQKAAGL